MSNIRPNTRTIAAAALVSAFACAAPSISQVQGEGDAASPPTTTTSFERHVTKLDDREIVIEIRDGEIATATINGEAIPAESIKHLDNGGFHIDQPGDARDYWINVNPGHTATIVGRRGANAAASHIVLVGPHGEPMTMGLPGWTAHADGQRQLPHKFIFTPVEQAADQPPPKVMIGVQMSDPGAQLAGHLGINPDETTLVAGVYPDLPAAAAGLEKYDVIVAINGEQPAGSDALREALADAEPDDVLKLTILRRGEQRDVEITLAPWDEKALRQPLAGMEGEDVREALRLAETLRSAAGAWAGENGATTFTVPALDERLAAVRALDDSKAMAERLEQVEQQLQRLEKLLSRLVEQEEPAQPPPAPAPPGPPALPHDDSNRWELRA